MRGCTDSYADANGDTDGDGDRNTDGDSNAYTYTDPLRGEMFTHAEAAPDSSTATVVINAQRPTPNAQPSIQSQSSTLGVRR